MPIFKDREFTRPDEFFVHNPIQKLYYTSLCFAKSSITRVYVLRFFNFWVIFGEVWGEIVFLKGLVKFREIRDIEDVMKN